MFPKIAWMKKLAFWIGTCSQSWLKTVSHSPKPFLPCCPSPTRSKKMLFAEALAGCKTAGGRKDILQRKLLHGGLHRMEQGQQQLQVRQILGGSRREACISSRVVAILAPYMVATKEAPSSATCVQ